MEIKKVGVVGCGIMGSGITQVCAQSGYQVVVSEINDQLLNKGLATINSSLAKSVEKEKITQQDKDATRARVKGTTDTRDFSDCDLIIEAAIEKLEVKQNIFAELDKIFPSHTILATNTSSVSIIDIAKVTTRADKVLGLHFFNPVPVMKLLEIVRSIATSDVTLGTANDFGKSIGKAVIIAQDTPAFIVNCLVVPFILNAIRMIESGVGSREDIDAGVTLGLNHPMGPLTLADLLGLDTLPY